VAYKVNLWTLFWEILSDCWLKSFWVHVFFPVQTLLVLFDDTIKHILIRSFWSLKVSISLMCEILNFTRVVDVKVKIVKMEPESFIHNL